MRLNSEILCNIYLNNRSQICEKHKKVKIAARGA